MLVFTWTRWIGGSDDDDDNDDDDDDDRWVWLAVYLPVQNISGGVLTFIMMTYSFISDNSTPRQEKHPNHFRCDIISINL